MSAVVDRDRHSRAYAAGQFIGGSLIVIVAIGICCALPLLPWHLARPALEFIEKHPVLDAFARALGITVFVTLHVLFLIWYERKFAGWMQARLGPMHVGWKGLLQTIADAFKLLLKEDIVPRQADVPLFKVAPFIAFMPTLLTFMVLPFSARWVGSDFGLAALFFMAVSTNVSLGVLAAGWGANNKYSLLGGARACAQALSYEIPMVMSVLCVAALTGSLSFTAIVEQQRGAWIIVSHWPVAIPTFLLYLICAMAELNRTPLDLPEAESELVSGFTTEYSGMRFAFFYLAEFANNFAMSAIGVTLFFGGWLGPGLPAPVWLTLKTLILVTLIMWIKWTMPRFRVDQMMGFCWKALVPISLVLLCATTLWTVNR